MLPDPLHPVVVHFPIALVVLLPVAAICALIVIRRGAEPRGTWVWVVAIAVTLAGSAWLAVQTGEDEEDVVEEVVAEAPIHEHEEAAERFLWLSAAAAVVFGLGLLTGRKGHYLRLAATAATVLLLVAGYRVGSSGGDLVYEHGAARAYVDAGPGGAEHEAAEDDEDEYEDIEHQ